MSTIDCKRCGKNAASPTDVPYPGKLGEEILAGACCACWEDWLAAEVMIINELRLNFMDPKSQDVLMGHLREFLKLDATSGD